MLCCQHASEQDSNAKLMRCESEKDRVTAAPAGGLALPVVELAWLVPFCRMSCKETGPKSHGVLGRGGRFKRSWLSCIRLAERKGYHNIDEWHAVSSGASGRICRNSHGIGLDSERLSKHDKMAFSKEGTVWPPG